MQLYPLHRDKIKGKQLKERESVIRTVHAELTSRSIELQHAREQQARTLEAEIDQLRAMLEKERRITLSLREKVASSDASIAKMVETKFQKAYAIKIQEFKDTFNMLKDWKKQFKSKAELEGQLQKMGASLGKLPSQMEEEERKRKAEERQKQDEEKKKDVRNEEFFIRERYWFDFGSSCCQNQTNIVHE